MSSRRAVKIATAREINCPSGKSARTSEKSMSSRESKNISLNPSGKSLLQNRRLVLRRGGSRSSRTRGGMRWTRWRRKMGAAGGGRRSRVVLTPRRWRQVGGMIPLGDGGKKARSPGRARNKPLKPLRREGRIVSADLWWLTRVLFTFACEAAGASDTRLSLRPLSSEGQGSKHNLGRASRRGSERAHAVSCLKIASSRC